MARRRTIRKKITRGKIWFKLHAPKIFKEAEIGETIGKDAQAVMGRVLDTPLSEINGDITKHNVKLKLKVDKIVGEHAYTKIIAYELSRPFLQRMIRKRVSKLDIVMDLRLKDERKYRIKSIAISLHKAESSKLKSLRKELEQEIEKAVKPFDIETLIVTLLTNKIQREIQKKVSKIYPVRFFDIRKIELLKEKVMVDTKKPKPKAESTQEHEAQEAKVTPEPEKTIPAETAE